MLRSLSPLWRHACLVCFKWARAEMDPLHPDLPYVIRRINELERP
jgi:hypothetical protein